MELRLQKSSRAARRIERRLRPLYRHSVARWFAFASLAVLLGTTIFWSGLSAQVHLENADQLVNTYLSKDWHTFSNAVFPAAHSFLFKWPLFAVMQALGGSSQVIIVATVMTTVVTVGFLACVIGRIERRPLVFGIYMLALSSMLLYVPAQPAPGALLPVNLAMVATRNIEYVLYIVAIIAVARMRAWRSWWLVTAALLLAVLFASDKLFMFIGFGAAMAALTVYGVTKRTALTSMAVRWLAVVVLGTIGSWGILALVRIMEVTAVAATQGASPFDGQTDLLRLVLGIVFAVTGLLTTFGANPVFDISIISTLPSVLKDRLANATTIGYMVNGLLLVLGLWAAARLVMRTWRMAGNSAIRHESMANQVSILLIWSTIAACAAFVVTNHYYAADARYLAVALFAVTISTATYFRHKTIVLGSNVLWAVTVGLSVSILLGLQNASDVFSNSRAAMDAIHQRNAFVAASMTRYKNSVLVGDYWRVVPIKGMASHLDIMPLGDCIRPQEALSSRAWQYDIQRRPFVYLLSTDKGLTDKPGCNIEDVTAVYGQPDSATIVAGTAARPIEMLLAYEGSNYTRPAHQRASHAVELPIALPQMPYRQCSGRTVVQVVAHQDDDLLFMNPDLQRSLKAKECIRTIYVTAGDAGLGDSYWHRRELGARFAYDALEQKPGRLWNKYTVRVGAHAFVAAATPQDDPRVSLIFLRLKDGNLNGSGFGARGESLGGMLQGRVDYLTSVDGRSRYTYPELVAVLTQLVSLFSPDEIRTHATKDVDDTLRDHSDHAAVGRLVKRLHSRLLAPNLPVRFYYGYPVRMLDSNVSDAELTQKLQGFLAYVSVARDTGCDSGESCLALPTYGDYLRRQHYY